MMSAWEDMKANGKAIAALEFDLAEARAQIAAKDAQIKELKDALRKPDGP
jgi:hypothetical protein